MGNYLLTIAYDGSEFHGWQKQPSEKTVQGYLEETFSHLFNRQIKLSGTSRTDAGVHALGQRASFHADLSIPVERLPMIMNNALCGREDGGYALSPVRVMKAEEKPEDFHARFDCTGKKYIYRIQDSEEVDLFGRNYVYYVGHGRGERRKRLDVEAMKRAAELIVGTHDFKSFEAAGGNPRETTIRTVFEAKVSKKTCKSDDTGEITVEISGDGLLYNMVRIITGTLVEVGLGNRDPEEIKNIIETKDRRAAGHTAPPYGLYLAEVYYDKQ